MRNRDLTAALAWAVTTTAVLLFLASVLAVAL